MKRVNQTAAGTFSDGVIAMKWLVWLLIGVGLLPCILVATLGILYRQQLASEQQLISEQQSLGLSSSFIHDRYFRLRIGTWELELYPRLWAFALLAFGITAITASMVFLLHVPLRNPKS